MKAHINHKVSNKDLYKDPNLKKALKAMIGMANTIRPVADGYNLCTPDMEVHEDETSENDNTSEGR